MTRPLAPALLAPALLAPVLLALVLVAPTAAPPALAAGGGTPTKEKASDCKRGEVYSERRERCVREDSSGLTNEDRYETGRALAHAGRHEDAIAVLLAADAGDVRVLSYLGFAHRKAGRLDEGMRFYEAALRIDPDFTLARSYMGQAMLEGGDGDGAREQLRLIRAATGPVSLEYVMLRDAIAGSSSAY